MALFSERNVSQWGWVWGQFIDHCIERAETGSEEANIPFNSGRSRWRASATRLGSIPFTRNAVAPGTGTGPGNPRQQVNLVGSYIDASQVYGDSASRLEWLRTGPDNGKPGQAGATLLLPHKYLPLATARGDAASGAFDGDRRRAGSETPQNAVVAGDVRANENAELTAATTLFAREHNRIVEQLPCSLSNEEKFQIARRFVAAEEQYITYNEFLPAVGVTLSPYTGYDPERRHRDQRRIRDGRLPGALDGQRRGDRRSSPPRRSRAPSARQLEAMGVTIAPCREVPLEVRLDISQLAAFYDPALVPHGRPRPDPAGAGRRTGLQERRADRRLPAQRPVRASPSPAPNRPRASPNPNMPGCFSVVEDLGAIDVQRGRDNGMPTYNEMREAVGPGPADTFTEVTGESTEEFPTEDPLIPPTDQIENPHILEFTSLQELLRRTDPAGL